MSRRWSLTGISWLAAAKMVTVGIDTKPAKAILTTASANTGLYRFLRLGNGLIPDLKSIVRKAVLVQLPPSAPECQEQFYACLAVRVRRAPGD